MRNHGSKRGRKRKFRLLKGNRGKNFQYSKFKGRNKCFLSEIQEGKKCRVKRIQKCPLRARLFEIGIVEGTEIEVIRHAPFKDPIQFRVDDFFIGLRRNEAALIEVENNY
ncbi:MAG: FeoA family protein [Candidatus Hodarchaeales archaeon]